MAGCEKIDGFGTWPGWAALGVAVATMGVIVAIIACNRSDTVSQTAKGDGNIQISVLGDRNKIIIQQIAKETSQPIEVLQAILTSMGEKELDEAWPERIESILRAKASEYLQLNERLRQLGDSDPEVAKLKEQAAQALQGGQFQEADGYLERAEQLDIQATEKQEAAARKRRASAANTLAERAGIAKLQPNPVSYRRAAEFFGKAANLVADFDTVQARSYQFERASMLYELGKEFGQSVAWEETVALYRQILSSTSRKTEPLDWAATQNNLGTVLQILGDLQGDEAQLQESVTAYREALKEYTHERAPRDWAETQNSLGDVLGTLGSLRNDEKQLQESVAAYREALEERTRERAPRDWATTQNNLGLALYTLGSLRNDETQLQAAVAAYREALKEYTRERAPLNWATTQNNLGNVLQTFGSRRGDEAQLQESVTAYRDVLKEFTRERAPLNWAMTQNNIGTVLGTLGARRGDEAQLQESMTAFRAALEVFAESGASHDVQMTKDNLSRAEALLEQLKKRTQ
ncbi:MAG: tetratricopeptide repeat protein [Azoarcus sp.]|jgi:tetratricopeptide (TPR) repeat protein|nr:tetratricopeptide repeat protein [Azoarcus sp.]